MNAMAPPDKYKIKGQKLGQGKNSTVLGENIKKHRGGNYTKCQNCESHHIVPGGKGGPGTDLDKLRHKMKDLGVDINEGVQGVDLPKNIHNWTKTKEYDGQLWNALKDKNTPEAFRDALIEIGDYLKAGKKLDGKLI